MGKVCNCSGCGAQCSNKYHGNGYSWKDPDANVLCKKCYDQSCKESAKAWGIGIPFVIGIIVSLIFLMVIRDAQGTKYFTYAAFAGLPVTVGFIVLFGVMTRRASNGFTRWLWRFIKRCFFGACAMHILASYGAYKILTEKSEGTVPTNVEQVQESQPKE